MTGTRPKPALTVLKIVTAFAVVLAIFGVAFIFAGSDDGPADSERTFDSRTEPFEINAEVVRVASPEGPVYFPDPLGTQREIYVIHEGESETDGYRAFSARGTSGCKLQYTPDPPRLVDTCTGQNWRPDGLGLPHYGVRLEGGTLLVDITEVIEDGIGRPANENVEESDEG